MSPTEHIVIKVAEGLPGGGSSTLTAILEKLLTLEKISVGQFRRAIALFWKAYCPNNNLPDEAECWRDFEKIFSGVMENDHPTQALQKILLPYLNQFCDNATLLGFNRVQATYSPTETFWDKIPDMLAHARLSQPTATNGYILDSKLGPRYDEILGNSDGTAIEAQTKSISLWLDVEVINSAIRVVRRDIENGKLLMPGMSSDVVIEWLHDRDAVSKDQDILIEAWIHDVIDERIGQNPARIAEDIARYRQAYDMSSISIPYLRSAPEVHLINANRSLELVVADALSIIHKNIPSLVPANLLEMIAESGLETLKQEIHQILEEMSKRKRD